MQVLKFNVFFNVMVKPADLKLSKAKRVDIRNETFGISSTILSIQLLL